LLSWLRGCLITCMRKMLEVNGVKKLVRRPPPLSAVKNWVEQAKKLKRVVEY